MTKTAERPEKMEFKTELKQLLHLITHSLYSNKEIFLRELISNASDAINKIKFDSLQHEDQLEGDKDWKIKIHVDRDAGTLTVSDNGVGLSRDDAVANLGTIAKSGTRAFLESLQGRDAKAKPELIGQFGVGFYSAFMVADKVTVVSRHGRRPRPGRPLGVGRPGRFHGRNRPQGPPRHGRDFAPQAGGKGVSGPVHRPADRQEVLQFHRASRRHGRGKGGQGREKRPSSRRR